MMGKQKGVIIISTFANEEQARSVSKKLVEKGFAACANLIPVRSIYTWQGKIEDQEECLVFFKTVRASANMLKKEIVRLHSYDVPEIVEVTMTDASKPYLDWLIGSTNRKTQKGHNASKRGHT